LAPCARPRAKFQTPPLSRRVMSLSSTDRAHVVLRPLLALLLLW
jgi:hypothetical protein